MSTLLKTQLSDGTGHDYWFYCPGCKETHRFTCREVRIPGVANWSFNGNMENPTFTPSLHYKSGEKTMCHLFVKEGKIQFLNDCRHELAGKTLPLEDMDNEVTP